MQIGSTPLSPVRGAGAVRLVRAARTLVAALLVLAAGLVAAQATPPAAPPAQTEAAIRALDQAVSANPADPVLRVRLAMALLDQGRRDRARFHLMQARGASGLAPQDRKALDRLLDRLDGARSFEGWLRLAIVPETNPGQQTGAATVDWGGFTWALTPGARAAPATGLHLGIGGALLPRIAPGLRLRLGAAVEARLFERTALNDVTARAEFGLQGQTGAGAGWGLWLTAQDRRIGNTAYGQAAGLVATWTQRTGPRGQMQLRAEADRWRHAVQTARDGTRRGVSLAYTHALRPDLMLRATAFGQWVDARARWEAGRTLGAGLGVQKQFAGGLVVSLDVLHMRQRREAADPGFGVLRRDRRTSLTARVMHRTVSLNGFAPVLELGLDRQRSTLPLSTFRNARVSVGLTRQF